MQAEESHIGEAILQAGDRLVNLHLAESNRCALGEGSLDLDTIIMALYVIGYNRAGRYVLRIEGDSRQMSDIVLENEALRLRFAAGSGRLCELVALETGWNVLERPELGLSFRLLVPMPGRRHNPVNGEQQAVSTMTPDEDGRGLTLVWSDVESVHGGRLDITVTEHVRLSARQAVFALTIDNHSPYPIENVYLPYLGDVRPPSAAEPFSAFTYSYATSQEWPLSPKYENSFGYYGDDYPTQFGYPPAGGAPTAPFVLLRDAGQGLYVGVHEASAELVSWHTELRPGYGDAIDSSVPEGPAASGKDVCTRFAAVHVPYIQPGERRTLTPIAVEPYRGGWQQGVDRYRAWRATWMKPAPVPAWAQEPHSWQQIQMNSPEDELRFRFTDLVKVGEECARHGVRAIQLVGWNDGGQDQNNPSHSPDPRLGTAGELRAAIAAVRKLGVKVILFSKFTWADRATTRFREDLIRLAVKDPYGDYYMHPGYKYFTATQLLDINTKRLIPMCFLADEYLRVCEEEFKKVLALEPDGILFDECLHHGPALLCFDPTHGHRTGAPVYANDRELIRRLHRLSAEANVDFLFAGEACYDWEFEQYHLSYFRSWSPTHVPLSRYMLPQAQLMTAVTGFDDRNMLNQCLLYRYVISYEPYNFKGRLDDFPLTIAYGKQVDALRTELREYLWDGEYRGTAGAGVTAGGKPHHPYTVFRHKDDTSLAVAVANYDARRAETVVIRLGDGRAPARYRLVEDPTWRPVNGGVEIPARSAAVFI